MLIRIYPIIEDLKRKANLEEFYRNKTRKPTPFRVGMNRPKKLNIFHVYRTYADALASHSIHIRDVTIRVFKCHDKKQIPTLGLEASHISIKRPDMSKDVF